MGTPAAGRGARAPCIGRSQFADAAVLGGGILLAALSAAAQRLDVRTGNTPLRREVVTGAVCDGAQPFQRGRRLPRRGACLHRGELSAGNARSESRDRSDKGADAALAPDPLQQGMDRAALAKGTWRSGLVDHATLHL